MISRVAAEIPLSAVSAKDETVGIATTVHGVAPEASGEHIPSGIADQRVVSGSSVDPVVSAAPAIRLASEAPNSRSPRDEPVMFSDRSPRTSSALARGRECGEVDRDGGGDAGEGCGIGAKLADEKIISEATIERIVAATVEVGVEG